MTFNKQEYMKEYQKKNKLRLKEYRKKYHQKHKEKENQQSTLFRKENPKYDMEYYNKNKEERKKYNKKWEAKNKEHRKKYMKENNNQYYQKNKDSPEFKLNHQKHVRIYRKKYPEREKAQRLAQQIPLKPNCQICNSTQNLERHHWDYNQPLLVATLCRTCHRIQHIKHFNSTNKFNIN